MTYPFAGEIKMTKVIKDGKEAIEWEQVDMSKHSEGNLGIGSSEMTMDGVKWDASAPLVVQPHSAFQKPESRITFYAGDVSMEVMRIDKHGVKVNPEFTVDEVTRHVVDALTAHIQHTINHAVLAEREACAKVCDDIRHENYAAETDDWISGTDACAAAIRARSNQ